ncbi:MAG: CBS domain-containing protein, partial [Acidiphilium sp.]|nr:CBS domain-containing protein [Acidiphilium sp.]
MTIAPTTVGPETTIADAGRVMLDRHLSALPVIDRDGRLLGIVTDG